MYLYDLALQTPRRLTYHQSVKHLPRVTITRGFYVVHLRSTVQSALHRKSVRGGCCRGCPNQGFRTSLDSGLTCVLVIRIKHIDNQVKQTETIFRHLKIQ